MLVCAGLFLRSLHNVRSIETGFDRHGVLIVTTDASRSGLTPAAQRAAFREVIARLGAIPGVVRSQPQLGHANRRRRVDAHAADPRR